MLGLRKRCTAVVGEVVALRFAVGIGYRCISLVAATCVADACLRIVEHVSLVDVELLLSVELAAVLLSLDELVVHSVGGIVNDAHLHIGKRIPTRTEVVSSLYKPTVVVLVGI